MNKQIFAEIIGGAGAVLILIAYGAINFNIIYPNEITYQLLNFVGSIGILYTSYVKNAKQPMILNIIWALIAVIAIWGILLK